MSFKINRGSTNTVILTLKEKSTLANPFYLFSLTSRIIPSNNRLFTCSDLSIHKDRHNKFSIIESNTEDLLNGTVTLEEEGFWDYVVYEQVSSTNLLVANTTGIVERGLVRVLGTAISPVKHSPVISSRKAHKVT